MMEQKDRELDHQRLSIERRCKELDQRELNMRQEVDSQ